MPEATKPSAMLGLIERLTHVRAIGINPERGHLAHQARLTQLAREAGRATARHIAGYERRRRHATLVAATLDLASSLTDQAIDLFDRLIGAMFRKAEGRHTRAFQADARAINEKVRLYARVGAALIAAQQEKQGAFGAIKNVIPRDRFCATVAEAGTLARPDEFGAWQNLGEHCAGIRRWSPTFLASFKFESVPAAGALLRAVQILRDLNAGTISGLPDAPPTSFIRERRARLALADGKIHRRRYELCVLSELRDRRPACDVRVACGRQYRSFKGRLISREAQRNMQAAGTLPVSVETDFDRFIEQRRDPLGRRMSDVDARAKGGPLPDVTIDKGVMKITLIDKSMPPEAEVLATRLYAMPPRIRVTDLLAEVAKWTDFPDCFTHLRTGEAADHQILMASLLADGLNLGLTRRTEARGIASLGQLAWTSDWRIRDEACSLALRRLVNQQQIAREAAQCSVFVRSCVFKERFVGSGR